MTNDINILPLNDILLHYEDAECWCDPEVEVIGANLLIIHNSFDGREYKERELALLRRRATTNGDDAERIIK